MNKKLFYILFIISILVIVSLSYYVIGYLLDPFGAPQRGAGANCGPEERYDFDVDINSKQDFVNFIKTHEINQWVRLDNFKNVNYSASYFEEPYLDYLKSKEANWSEVLDAVKTKNVGFKTLYVLDYVPFSCGEFTLKMTSDGKASVYGCCGY